MSNNSGISWPIDPNTKKPSTTATAKQIWLAALEPLLSKAAPDVNATSTKNNDTSSSSSSSISSSGNDNNNTNEISRELIERAQKLHHDISTQPNKSWRHNYIPFLVEHATIMALSPSIITLEMARCGLEKLSSLMDYNGTTTATTTTDRLSARDAVLNSDSSCTNPFETLTITSSTTPSSSHPPLTTPSIPAPSSSPHGRRTPLTSQNLQSQLSAWASYGCIEPDAADALSSLADADNADDISTALNDIRSNVAFVLLGATSALGPWGTLLQLGVTIVAVARPGIKLRALVEDVSTTAAEGTTVLFPQRSSSSSSSSSDDDKIVGGDLIADTIALARWITSLEKDKRLVICQLAYADGEVNVRANVGGDLIAECVMRERGDTVLCYIPSPSTVHLIPTAAVAAQDENHITAPFWQVPFSLTALERNKTIPLPNNPGYHIYNGLSTVQGPNYALTKTFQFWRAILSHSRGHVISSHFGPPTRTSSMISHRTVALALEGMQYFKPHVAFDEIVASRLMAWLMLNDTMTAVAKGGEKEEEEKEEEKEEGHVMSVLAQKSCHGGCWRCPYATESLGMVSVMLGQFTKVGQSPIGSLPETN